MSKKPEDQRLEAAYKDMLARVNHALKDFEQITWPKLQKSITEAKETSTKVSELTHKEADIIGHSLEKDFLSAGKVLKRAGVAIKDWAEFDWEVAEEQLMRGFLSVADKTELAWLRLQQGLPPELEYHAGEITALGKLECICCGEVIDFNKISTIPPCPKCHKTTFVRSTQL